MSPDVSQTFINNIFALFSHNYIGLVYFFGVGISIVLSIWRPSRFSVFMLLGFIILLFSYEYDKHIIVPFREQTLKSFTTSVPHYKLERLINISIAEIFPMLLYTLGWFFIFLGITYAGIKLNKQQK